MRRCAALACLLAFIAVVVPAADPKAAPEAPEGVLPVGADGKPLNLDFETGTLKDWTAEGDAFKDQPVKGDTVAKRRADNQSQHQGQYWIGGYEVHGDKPQGTLTSVPFKVTHSWASFLVGGGPHETTCVELVRKDTNEVFHRSSGLEEENLRRVVVDLRPLQGKEIFIRIVDKHSGHWGHVNFDDFRFHTEKPSFPERKGMPDVLKFAGLPPDKAAAAMTVPEGFKVTLFAGEPNVRQPIALCLDDRGRVWVAEAYCYPIRRPEKEANDRIVIFEDSKGTGTFDKRTVFMEGLNLVSGLEVGFGGVWIGAAPNLLFVPFKEGEDKPSGPAKIVLDGWGYQDTHEMLNTFNWGPDGWLYGCHGVFTHSRVGKPGTPDNHRIPINAGVWRYHPTKEIFEVFAEGTSNPWGLDFDRHGQAFIEACVIPHAFHMIQSGRYQRQAGNHFNPHTYADIQTIADHLHWQGANPWAGNNKSDSAGGGHAHAGLMIYQGAAWPEEYRGKMFMGNIHGRRLNMDILKPKGSGFVASHGPDFLLANDAWARFINMRYGPDGNVFVIDWYDQQACHNGDTKSWDRSNGRIYKVSYRGTKPVTDLNLQKCKDKELVQYLLHDNEWYARHARRILQERYADPEKRLPKNARYWELLGELGKIARDHPDDTRRLRALWTAHALGTPAVPFIVPALKDKSEYVRGWALQLALEDHVSWNSTSWLEALSDLAKNDPSPVVRRYVASAAARILTNRHLETVAITLENPRGDVLGNLLAHGEDADDPNLPLLDWYALEGLASFDRSRALKLAAGAKLPQILQFTARRVASDADPAALTLVVKALAAEDEAGRQRSVLRGFTEALKGRRQVEMPKERPDVFARLSRSKDDEVRSLAFALAVTFGDPKAFAELQTVLANSKEDLAARQSALAALLGARDRGLPVLLHRLVGEPAMRGAALKGLAGYDDPKTPAVILAVYANLTSEEKRDALNTLAARVGYAQALLDAVAAKKVPASDVSADIVRQMGNLHDKELDRRIGKVWGVVRTTPADRLKMIADFRKKLSAAGPTPDLTLGRAMFAKTCQQCHTLYGVGGKVGPDITGSNRANLDYLLENILDPSAVIPKEYTASIIELKNGRVITGIVRQETPAALTVLTPTEAITVPRGDIESRKESNVSMMPDDLLKPFKEEEIRALIAYLRNPTQTPILATAENAKNLFNGKDLTGWDGDPKLWKVEAGEIVGKGPGIKKNEFLRSQMTASDFRLTLKIKLLPNKENSGIQFRSEVLPEGDVRGPQADVGEGYWGKLYEENGRGMLWDRSGEKFVKAGEWNEYEIIAEGSRVRTFINGNACVDLTDEKLARRGIFALQMHAGGAMEVRFKDIRLEVK